MAGYIMNKDDGATRFDVEPEGPPVPVVEAVVVVGVCAMWFAINAILGLACVAAFGTFYMFVLYRSPKAVRYRKRTAFKVDGAGVEFEGKSFPVGGIHRLVMRNHVAGTEGGLHVAFGAAQATGYAMRSKRLRKLAEVSYRLDVEAGGKATTLAGGLAEPAAYGLMQEVGNILGMK